VAPLEQGFSHQAQLREVGCFKGKFEITNPSMQELGAAAAGATAEVMALEQCNPQAAADRFIGHAASTGPAADDDEIKTLISHSSAGSY
jgi:hypothetical protein